jgi:D-alanyl-D-alanine carboxypeptidase
VGYVEAEGGRRLAISIMVRDVPVSSAQEIFPEILSLTEEQDKLAVAIQQGY